MTYQDNTYLTLCALSNAAASFYYNNNRDWITVKPSHSLHSIESNHVVVASYNADDLIAKVIRTNKSSAGLHIDCNLLYEFPSRIRVFNPNTDAFRYSSDRFKVFELKSNETIATKYNVVAILDCSNENSILYRFSNNIDEEFITRCRNNPNHCDECNTNRRRNKVFIIRHADTGKLMQVGGACAKTLVSVSELLFSETYRVESVDCDIDGECIPGGSNYLNYFDTDDVLNIAYDIISRFGYISSNEAYESFGNKTATKQDVLAAYDHRKVNEYTTPFKYDIASDVRHWIQIKAATCTNDYHINLLACSEDLMSKSAIALACAAVNSYINDYDFADGWAALPNTKWSFNKATASDKKAGRTVCDPVLATPISKKESDFGGYSYLVAIHTDSGDMRAYISNKEDLALRAKYILTGIVKENRTSASGSKYTKVTHANFTPAPAFLLQSM